MTFLFKKMSTSRNVDILIYLKVNPKYLFLNYLRIVFPSFKKEINHCFFGITSTIIFLPNFT